MLSAFGQRLEQGLRRFLPLVSTLVFILLGSLPWPVPHFGPVTPSFGLIAVYYWSIHRPDLFRPFSGFCLGLLYDVIHFLPIGLSALVFIAVQQLVLSQRRFFVGHAFIMLWSGFALVMLLVMTGQWLALSFSASQWLSFLPIFLQGLLTIIVFPLPVWLLITLQRHLLSSV